MKAYFQHFSFFGELTNSENSRLGVFVEIEYDSYDSTIISCKIACKENEAEQLRRFFDVEKGGLVASGKISENQSIYIDIARWKEVKHNVAEVEVSQFTMGYSGTIPFIRGKYIVSIVLNDVPAVQVDSVGEMSYLGFISRNRKQEDAISWENELGKYSLADYYDHEKADVANEKATLQIKRTKIFVEKEFTQSTETEALLRSFEDEIKDRLLMLSFISRKWINWYEIDIAIFSEGEDRTVYNVTRRMKTHSKEDIFKTQLFHQKELKEGLFDKLTSEYKKSIYKEMLRRAINFLVASNQRTSIEAKIQAAYSALEAITTACCKKLGVNEAFEKDRLDIITDKLKNQLSQIFQEHEWSNYKLLDELTAKLFELRRRSLASRLVDAISLSKIEVIDIWYFHGEVLFDDKIRDIISRRNKLIHSGEIVDLNQLYRDLLRIQAISERLLLFMLDCLDMKRLFIASYRDLHSINELE